MNAGCFLFNISNEPFCDGVFECWTTRQLETFVNAIAGLPIPEQPA